MSTNVICLMYRKIIIIMVQLLSIHVKPTSTSYALLMKVQKQELLVVENHILI